MKKVVLALILSLFLSRLAAQDPQFSQFYENQLYHNPAFAGFTGTPRLMLAYRNQWPALGSAYQTMTTSFDTYLGESKMGLGAQVMQDRQGAAFVTNQVAIQGAYRVGLSEKMNLYSGLQVGWANQRWNEGVRFVDQYSASGVASTSTDPLAQGWSNMHLDYAAGVLFEAFAQEYNINSPSLTVGAAVHHLNRAARSLDGRALPTRVGIHGSWRFPLRTDEGDERSIRVTAYYRKQGPNQQLDAGVNWVHAPLSLGLWYRGIPIRHFNQTIQQDALVAQVGFTYDQFRLGLSYDFTISSLSYHTAGAPEITLWYTFGPVFNRGRSPRRPGLGRTIVESGTKCKHPKVYHGW